MTSTLLTGSVRAGWEQWKRVGLARPVPTPALNPLADAVALWRADTYPGSGTLTDLSGNGHHARLGSTSGADTNDPLYLPYSSVDGPYVAYPASSAFMGGIFTADKPSLRFTGSFDLRARIDARGDYVGTDSANGKALISKWAAGADRSYFWYINLSGRMSLRVTPDGTHAGSVVFTSGVDISSVLPAGPVCLRTRFTLNNGSGRSTVDFQWRADANLEAETGWTTLDTLTHSTVVVPHVGGDALTVGLTQADGRSSRWSVYRAQLRNDAGTVVADFDPSRSTEPHSSFISATGETWTIGRPSAGPKLVLVDRPLFLFGGDDFMEVPDHDDLDMGAGQDFTVVAVRRVHGAGIANAGYITKKAGAGAASAGWAIRGGATTPAQVVADISDGTTQVANTSAGGPSGAVQVTAAIRTATTLVSYLNGLKPAPTTGTSGPLANTEPVRIGRLGTAHADMEFIAAAIWRRALSDEELAAVGRSLGVGS